MRMPTVRYAGAPERGGVKGLRPPGYVFRGGGSNMLLTPPCFWKANLMNYCLNK